MNARFFVSIIKKIIFIAIFIVLINYYGDASRRSTAENWSSQSSTEDDGTYTTRYTYLTSHVMVIRLYKTGEKTLLAERTFDHSDMPRVFWTKDKLIYSTNDSSTFYDGFINLPPTWIDRLLAQLP